jgi:hypothetical protein
MTTGGDLHITKETPSVETLKQCQAVIVMECKISTKARQTQDQSHDVLVEGTQFVKNMYGGQNVLTSLSRVMHDCHARLAEGGGCTASL